MSKKGKIHISTVLSEFDDKLTTEGKQKEFSIKFVKNNGEIVFKPKCVASGLNHNLKAFSQRGVLPIDEHGDASSHIYPVYIWTILEYNGKEVVLR